MTGEPLGDVFHRLVVLWTFAMALIVGLLNGGPPSSPSAQLSFDFMEQTRVNRMRAAEQASKRRLRRFYPYTTPFGNS